jgi:hypothetical protein
MALWELLLVFFNSLRPGESMPYTELENFHESVFMVFGPSTELYLGLLLVFAFLIIALRVFQV